MIARPARCVAVLVVASALLAACGGGRSHDAADVSGQLRQDLHAVASAAARHDFPAAASALAALDADAAAARANGTLSVAQLDAIRAAMAGVQNDLAAVLTPPVTVTVAPPPARDGRGDHGGGQGNSGPGRGGRGDGGGDG